MYTYNNKCVTIYRINRHASLHTHTEMTAHSSSSSSSSRTSPPSPSPATWFSWSGLTVAVLLLALLVDTGAAEDMMARPSLSGGRVLDKKGFRNGAGDRFSHGFGKRFVLLHSPYSYI